MIAGDERATTTTSPTGSTVGPEPGPAPPTGAVRHRDRVAGTHAQHTEVMPVVISDVRNLDVLDEHVRSVAAIRRIAGGRGGHGAT